MVKPLTLVLNGMRLQIIQVSEFQCGNVCRFQNNGWRHSGLQRFHPPGNAQTPPIAGLQTIESEFGVWRTQIVSGGFAEFEKLGCHFRTQEMYSHVSRNATTAAIALVTRHRVGRTAHQLAAQNIAS